MNSADATPSRLSIEQERDFVARARQGDAEAFNRLVLAFDRALRGHVLVRLDGGEHDAQDVTQEVWSKLGASFRDGSCRFDPDRGRFYTYLIQFLVRDALRRWRTRRAQDARITAQPPPDADSAGDPLILAEDDAARSGAMRLLFRLTFQHGGYPHQLLTFAFSKLLYGAPSARGIEGDPARLDLEQGAKPLSALLETFFTAYSAAARLPPREKCELAEALGPLRIKLLQPVEVVLAGDAASLRHYTSLAGRITGETALRDWSGLSRGGCTTAFPEWCFKVEKRVRVLLGLEKGSSEETVFAQVREKSAEGC